MAEDKVRVLLIEDHGIVREGLKLILELSPDITVVGDAATGGDGVRLFQRLSLTGGVDVTVTDVGLPDISGLEVTRRIKEAQPEARVLILTMYADPHHILGMLEAGADGYLLKTSAAHTLSEAIRTVARGETSLSPTVSRWLMKHFGRGQERMISADLLSGRERQIIVLLAEGSTSKEIAQQLGLSTKTVENHRAHILQKLQATNSAAAIRLAYQHGIIASPNVA